jgi:hypothetical protein
MSILDQYYGMPSFTNTSPVNPMGTGLMGTNMQTPMYDQFVQPQVPTAGAAGGMNPLMMLQFLSQIQGAGQQHQQMPQVRGGGLGRMGGGQPLNWMPFGTGMNNIVRKAVPWAGGNNGR